MNTTTRVLLNLLLGCSFWAVSEAANRPNVLLIVSDDQGYNDLGVLGNGIITPALDRISREGVRLTNFYVSWPACTPSRASLLTGRYPQRNGIYDMIRNEAPDYGHEYSASEYKVTFERIGGMDVREVTIANLLRSNSYRTAIYGKWDLGSLKRFLPGSRGFESFYGFVNTGIDYYTHRRYGVPSMYRDWAPTTEDEGTYCTHLFEREALKFIDQWAGIEPFFLYLPFNAPHNSSALDPRIRTSIQAPDKYKQMYPEVNQEYRQRPQFRYAAPATVVTKEARRRDYQAAVTCMDDSIGKILSRLATKGCLDDTIVIFLSDNGGGGGSDNSPLKGGKSTMWEGGLRVPCLVRWPNGGIPKGKVIDELLTSLEILPSLAKATGTKVPSSLDLDGFDWWPVLGNDQPSPRTEMFWKRKTMRAARVGKWKWVKLNDQPAALFDLAADIGEKQDLSQRLPDQAQRMQAAFNAWLTKMNATEPRRPFDDF